MEHESLPQRPEGKLLFDAQQASGETIKEVAARAGMSDTRWRQIVKGFVQIQNSVGPVIAPPDTLARMAQAVNVTAEQLRAAGRDDAAEELEHLQADPAPEPVRKPRSAPKRTPVLNDEIQMIYKSRSMTAEQKLEAIRLVLLLRAEVDAKLPSLRAEAAGDVAPAQTEDV